MTSPDCRPLCFSLSVYLAFPLLLFYSSQKPLPHLLKRSREMQQHYQRHMVQNQNPSQESPELFSYASSPVLLQTKVLQLEDKSWPKSH